MTGTQRSLTDDWNQHDQGTETEATTATADGGVTTESNATSATTTDETRDAAAAAEVSKRSLGPVEDQPAVADVAISDMVLETDADGWRSFPHPERITAHVEDDMDADQSSFPSEVRDAVDELTDDPSLGEFLVFDATAAYDYLETLQHQSDLHLENFYRRQLIVNQLSNGRGLAKGSDLSTYDKKWICQWEVRRRLADREFEEWPPDSYAAHLSKQNSGLPKAD